MDFPRFRFWDLLFQLCIDSNSDHDLAERLCVRGLPAAARTPLFIEDLSGAVSTVVSEFAAEHPNFSADMQLRQGPLHEQWDAYGPGLWHQLKSLLDPAIFVDHAEIYLVSPVLGGMGWAHLLTNRCHLEAVLTNGHPKLSEVMRLAWLLSQLDFDRPMYSDLINLHRLRTVAGMAMLVPLLVAAEELGILQMNSELLAQAIHWWQIIPNRVKDPSQQAISNQIHSVAEVLLVWWDTLRSGETQWSLALTGLDRMLSDFSDGHNLV
jgi:hypothetical protein